MKKSASFRGAAYSCALAMLLSGCGAAPAAPPHTTPKTAETATAQPYTGSTLVQDVINDAAFGDYGRLIFPADLTIPAELTLENLDGILVWYNNVNPDRTVEIANYLHDQAEAGNTIFYDIYTDAEKAADPAKEDTGLFFFRGEPGAKTAILNAGGGFMYVAAVQDSFPHALELSKRGYNAFALIYRPGAETACEDLARAIAFLHDHAEELQIDMDGYSLWGGSTGARMAAWLGSYGTAAFGEKGIPAPRCGHHAVHRFVEVYGNEPPTYNCVSTADGIANYRTMQRRIEVIRQQGTPAEIDIYPGLAHGFGLGEGTVAEGWLDHAVTFWQENT